MTSIAEDMLADSDDLEVGMLQPGNVADVATAAAHSDLDPVVRNNAEADYTAAVDTAQT